MNKKSLANIVMTLIAVVLIGVAGYFMFTKRTDPITEQPIPSPTGTQDLPSQNKPTSTQPASSTPQVSPSTGVATEQFNGLLRTVSTNSWSLVMSSGKIITLYPLRFSTNSTCTIASDEGPCSSLQSNFGKGMYSPGGGDSVRIDGNKDGDTIIVKKLVLNENFIANGHLTQTLSNSAQKTWSLVFQPSSGDSISQGTNRPTETIPLLFDANSGCGDIGKINCSSYALHRDDFVFVRGIRYKGVLTVRMLTIPATPPASIPR